MKWKNFIYGKVIPWSEYEEKNLILMKIRKKGEQLEKDRRKRKRKNGEKEIDRKKLNKIMTMKIIILIKAIKKKKKNR